MKKRIIPTALTIAGVDSGGGAGIAADLKTFAAIGVHGLVAVTSVTAQNTYSVMGIQDISPQMVELQIRAVADDMGVDAAKTGMLSNPEIVRTVARVVRSYGFPLVVDPVIYAKSGARLLLEEAVEVLERELLPEALIVTPNRMEAEKLAGMKIHSLEDAEIAATKISREYGVRAVVVKGGHMEGSSSVDVLYYEGTIRRFETPRVEGCTHGTGCSFSAAIAAYIAKGFDLVESVRRAKEFIYNAILRSYKIGRGHCPVNPSANVDLDAEIYRAQKALNEVVEELISKRSEELARLIPEVQMNIVYSPPAYLAKDIKDVVGIPGRIVNYMGRAKASGYPQPGASSHMARAVLTMMQFDPEIRSGVNIAYSEDIIRALKELDFKISYFDRREEPEEIKRI
ncbi:MAG: bifunctional hydroxymethylpyrimidine kinase/phosphomethylpyrimidine kinase, partial [Sulfolobales archaeon]